MSVDLKYEELSDQQNKKKKMELYNVQLILEGEVFIISNIILMASKTYFSSILEFYDCINKPVHIERPKKHFGKIINYLVSLNPHALLKDLKNDEIDELSAELNYYGMDVDCSKMTVDNECGEIVIIHETMNSNQDHVLNSILNIKACNNYTIWSNSLLVGDIKNVKVLCDHNKLNLYFTEIKITETRICDTVYYKFQVTGNSVHDKYYFRVVDIKKPDFGFVEENATIKMNLKDVIERKTDHKIYFEIVACCGQKKRDNESVVPKFFK